MPSLKSLREKERRRESFSFGRRRRRLVESDDEKENEWSRSSHFFVFLSAQRRRKLFRRALACSSRRRPRFSEESVHLLHGSADGESPGAHELLLLRAATTRVTMLRRRVSVDRSLMTPTGEQRPNPCSRAPPTRRRSTAPSAACATRTMWRT